MSWRKKTLEFVGGNIVSDIPKPDNERRSSTIIQTFKKAISGGKSTKSISSTTSIDNFAFAQHQQQQQPKISKSKSQTSQLSSVLVHEQSRLVPSKSFGRGHHRGVAGKSDSGRGSVGTGSTGRGSSPTTTSPISSPDVTNRGHHSGAHHPGAALSESDDSSLNSMDMMTDPDMSRRFQMHQNNLYKRTSVPNINTSVTMINGVVAASGITFDPDCRNVISGPVTTIPVDGGPPMGQLERLTEEISRLKVDKLELLRQNVSAQREVKRLREREVQLQADLTTASREIHRLRVNLKEAKIE